MTTSAGLKKMASFWDAEEKLLHLLRRFERFMGVKCSRFFLG
jgi:hypothetical protein